jgi:hypothetical protein
MSILKKVSKRLSITITAAVMFLYAVNSVMVSAQNVYEINSFTRFPQQMPNWCWVASAETSGKHLVYSTKTQSSAVDEIKGDIVDVGGDIYEIAEAANYFTNNQYNYVGYSHAYSIAFLKAQIMNNRLPILGAGRYINGFRTGGHAVTAYMVAYCNDGKKLIGYYDSLNDRNYICDFNVFSNEGYEIGVYEATSYTS